MSGQSWATVSRRDLPVTLTITEATLAVARERVRELLGERAGIAVEDTVQVTDELVSNACRHGEPPRTLRLSLTPGGRLRIEVDDASPEQPMVRTADRTGGLGLMMVDRLASSWGVLRRLGHKTVWAELDLARQATYLSAVSGYLRR